MSYSLNRAVPKAIVNGVLVQTDVVTEIKAGENRGVKLHNYNVVRDLYSTDAGNTSGTIELKLPRGANSSGFSIVLFVQENESFKILGAVKTVL